MDSVKVELTAPIEVVGEMRSSLTMKEITGGMLMRAGPYMRMVHQDETTGVELLPAGIGKLIAASASIPARSVEMLSAKDFQAAQQIILDFLGMAVPPETTAT